MEDKQVENGEHFIIGSKIQYLNKLQIENILGQKQFLFNRYRYERVYTYRVS